jgi:hypothetical protein
MDNLGENRKISIDQYSFPLCSELAGKELTVVAPKKNYTLKFEDEALLTFSETGTIDYQCLKIADGVYLAALGSEPRIAVLDLKERLATLVLPEVGYIYGAVEQEWKALPEGRHCERRTSLWGPGSSGASAARCFPSRSISAWTAAV